MKTNAADARVGYLGQLGQTLILRGWYATVIHPDSAPPYLRVTNPAALRLTERVHCERTAGGTWWYAWPWRTRIGSAGDLPGAAEKVTRVLGSVDA